MPKLMLAVVLLALFALPARATTVLEPAVVEQRWSVYSGPVHAMANLDGYVRRPYADAEIVSPLLSMGLPLVAGLSTFYVSDLNQKIGLLYVGSAMAGAGYFYIDEPLKGTLYSVGGPIVLTASGTLGLYLGGGFSRCSECYMPNPMPLILATFLSVTAMWAYLSLVGFQVRNDAWVKSHPERQPPSAPPLWVPPPLGNEFPE